MAGARQWRICTGRRSASDALEADGHLRRGERTAALTERVCVIVNPAAGRGRGAKMLPEVRSAFAAQGTSEILVTDHSADEKRMALEAITAGYTTIVCLGGDGTCSNVANAILEARSDARLGVISAGTGNDFARTVGLHRAAIDDIARQAVQPSNTRIDVGRIEEKFFLNSCGFGFDVAVLQGLARARWIGNNLVYFYSAIQQILGFRGIEMSIASPAISRPRALHLLAVFANGSRFGGGLAIAPSATVTDGMLDAVLIRDAPRARRVRLLAAAFRGTHGRLGEVASERAARFTLEFDDDPLYESDGELHQAGSRQLTIECVPAALRVLVGPRFNVRRV